MSSVFAWLGRCSAGHMHTETVRTATDLIRTVTQESFADEVLAASGPVVVEFMSYGCEYCRALEPVLDQVAALAKSKSRFFRVNVAVELDLAEAYEIESTPTLIMFLNGKIVGRSEGPSPTVSSLLTAVTQPFRGRV